MRVRPFLAAFLAVTGVLAAPASAIPIRSLTAHVDGRGELLALGTVYPSDDAPACGVRMDGVLKARSGRIISQFRFNLDACREPGPIFFFARWGAREVPVRTHLVCVRATQRLTKGRIAAHLACIRRPRAVPSVAGPPPAPPAAPSRKCDPNYTGACVPPYPPDVNCADINGPVQVVGTDVHHLDRDGHGVACE